MSGAVKFQTSLSPMRAGLVLGMALMAACQSSRKPPPPPPEPVKEVWKYPGEWKGGNKPITRMVINVDVQRAMLYNGKKEVGWTASPLSRRQPGSSRFWRR